MEPLVMFQSFTYNRFPRSFVFRDLQEVVEARTQDEVLPALQRIGHCVANGLHAAGYVSYEAAGGLDPGLAAHPAAEMPLVWFGVFARREEIAVTQSAEGESSTATGWTSSLNAASYGEKIRRIKDLIAAGDTYQVNFTFRRRFRLEGSPRALYNNLCRAQRASFCAYLEVGTWRIVSASPELFFSLSGDTITVRPMKGTAPRGRWLEEDADKQRRLRESEKERAENLMIVDLLRNDLGIISEPGSVRVESLFDIETLETVHQMTSTITSTVRAGTSIADIFQALFPCGSVTGAPKRRTMQVIAELEDCPRGMYTGALGFFSPGNDAVFSVAIRTGIVDVTTGEGIMGIGSGITWDAEPDAEYRECLAKGEFALAPPPDFDLVETLRWEPEKGYFLLRRHLRRMQSSAHYYGFSWNRFSAVAALQAASANLGEQTKMRLVLKRDGSMGTESAPLPPDPQESVFSVDFAAQVVHSANPFLFHKTTYRPEYAAELKRRPELLDVIFINERGEITEGANHNVVAHLDGELVTPPREAGLLAGTYRDALLAAGTLKERVLYPDDVRRADSLFLINSVRGWRRARLVS